MKSTVVLLLLSVLLRVRPSYGRVKSFKQDDTEECLQDSSRECDWNRSCSYRLYHPSCLAARVPYASLDDDRVSCCFKCCHYHFLTLNKLNLNRTAFEENQKYIPNYDLSAIADNKNMLLSNSRLYQLSNSIKIGNYNSLTKNSQKLYHSYKIATFKDFNGTLYDHTTKNTKRAIFIDLENECVSRDALRLLSSRMSGQGIHMLSMLFTKQLPCPPPMAGTERNSTYSGHRQLRIPSKNKKSKHPYAGTSPVHPRPRLNSRGIHNVLSLLPHGVRSTLAASQVKTKGMMTENAMRPILLDCSCAIKYETGRDLVRNSNELQSLCSIFDTHNLVMDIDEFSESQMIELKSYYQRLTTAKFSLSPVNGSTQSYCEWEALAFGAIPVMKAADMSKEFSKLYRDLPIHVVSSFTEMDEAYLVKIYTALQKKLFSNPSSYSFSKLYHPHLLHTMKNHFVYGKPAQRPWRNVDVVLKKTKVSSCAFEQGDVRKRDAVGIGSKNPYEFLNNPKPKIKSFKHQPRALVGSSIHDTDSSPTTPNFSRNDSKLIELVLPRCCENGHYEMDWLQQILSASGKREISASIYYKCLECLPASLAHKWLGQRDIMFETDYSKKHNFTSGAKRITLLDDSTLLSFGEDRVKQYPQFDRIHNGKEVTAYLTYILNNYDKLPNQIVFLHTSPHAHLHLPLFTTFLKYIITCDSNDIRPVDFMHLNVHYKSGPWGACCGKKGACRENTWKYLFSDYPDMGSVYSQASTYSSAQFVVSRQAIQKWPLSFWKKMQLAINGEHDLEGCPHSSDPNVPSWGGHQLTGQYERMWHIIFGQKRNQVIRRQDYSLPSLLRIDCMDDGCKSGAL